MNNRISQKELYDALAMRHGADNQEKFLQATVNIFGLGGLGSNVAVALTRCGIGHLRLIDYDRLDLTNLNRQQYFIDQVGMYKTEALRDNLLKINPYVNIEIITTKVTEDNISELLNLDGIICEAFDKPEVKSLIIDAFFSQDNYKDRVIVAASGMAGFGRSNSIVTKKINDNFYLCGDRESDVAIENKLVSSRVAICANHEANAIIELILQDR